MKTLPFCNFLFAIRLAKRPPVLRTADKDMLAIGEGVNLREGEGGSGDFKPAKFMVV